MDKRANVTQHYHMYDRSGDVDGMSFVQAGITNIYRKFHALKGGDLRSHGPIYKHDKTIHSGEV